MYQEDNNKCNTKNTSGKKCTIKHEENTASWCECLSADGLNYEVITIYYPGELPKFFYPDMEGYPNSK